MLRGTDWTEREVAAAVADYFDMLRAELQGQSYSKTEHRRGLLNGLDDRTGGAVEYKHQNISAVLIGMGLPAIIGYKPMGNYQELLKESVSKYVEENPDLRTIVRAHVEASEDTQTAGLPIDKDIGDVEEEPPDMGTRKPGVVREDRPEYHQPAARHTNYLALEAANRSLGLAGERFVLEVERARLTRTGRNTLAAEVEHVSQTRGDGLGYDIRSFDDEGHDRLIEVKTTRYGIYTPFFVSSNELAVSRVKNDSYVLCRVFEFKPRPKFFNLFGAIDVRCELTPQNYRARVGG